MRFLSKKQVRDLIGIAPTQVSRLEAAGQFPLRVHIGYRVFWVEDEVLEWMKERVAARAALPPIREAAE
jgi:prophage regulatory protein